MRRGATMRKPDNRWMVEHHASVLSIWRREVAPPWRIVHFDSHWDLGLTLPQLPRNAETQADVVGYVVDGTCHDGNFLHRVWSPEVIESFTWVMSSKEPRSAAQLLTRIRAELQTFAGVELEDVASLAMEGRTVRGIVRGVPVTMCGIAELNAVKDPNILDIDLDAVVGADFDPAQLQPSEVLLIDSLTQIGKIEQQFRTSVQVETIAVSESGGYLPGSVADLLRQALNVPMALVVDEPPVYSDGLNDSFAWIRSGNFRSAAARLSSERFDHLPGYWLACAMVETGLGNSEAALAAYEKVLNDPKSPAHALHLACHNTGYIYSLQEDPEMALQYYQHAYDLKQDPGSLYGMGSALWSMGELDAALAAFQQLLLSHPAHPYARYSLASILSNRHRWEAVAEILDPRVQYPPTILGTVRYLRNRAQEAFRMGENGR